MDYTEWYINRHGELVISDTDIFDHDEDDVWVMEYDRLVSSDHRRRHGRDDEADVYMVRID